MVVAYETAIDSRVQETLVQFLRTVPIRKRLWARADPGLLTFWLLTQPISDEDEEKLFVAKQLIYERVPDARFDFLVINPAMFDDANFLFQPPTGSEEIALD